LGSLFSSSEDYQLGDLYLCLGQDHKVSLRDPLREGGTEALDALMDHAMDIKPRGHDFESTVESHSGTCGVTCL